MNNDNNNDAFGQNFQNGIPTPPLPPQGGMDQYYGNQNQYDSSGKLAGTLIALGVIQIVSAVLGVFGLCANAFAFLVTNGETKQVELDYPNFRIASAISIVTSLIAVTLYIISATSIFKRKKFAVKATWAVVIISTVSSIVGLFIMSIDATSSSSENGLAVMIGGAVCSLIFVGVQLLLLLLPPSRRCIRNEFS